MQVCLLGMCVVPRSWSEEWQVNGNLIGTEQQKGLGAWTWTLL